MKNLLFFLFLCVTFNSFCQDIKLNDTTANIQDLILKQKINFSRHYSQSYDTLNLYRKQMGVSKKVYEEYLHSSDRKTFSYSIWRESPQDRIFFNPTSSRHYFFHNRKGKLVWSATTFYEAVEIAGEKTFYNKSGGVKRIEYYDNRSSWHEQPGPEGVWQWYRKDGSLKKVVLYSFDYESEVRFKRTIKLNKKGKITKDKTDQSNFNTRKVYSK